MSQHQAFVGVDACELDFDLPKRRLVNSICQDRGKRGGVVCPAGSAVSP